MRLSDVSYLTAPRCSRGLKLQCSNPLLCQMTLDRILRSVPKSDGLIFLAAASRVLIGWKEQKIATSCELVPMAMQIPATPDDCNVW